MFAKPRHTRSGISGTLAFLEQVYFGTVRSMRKSSGRNAVLGLIGSMAQTVVFVMAFYFMFQLMGVRTSPIKGDYMLYIISGIAMFMIHNTAVQTVSKAEGPTSGMMQHAPMNTMIAVCSAALQSLYQQTITVGTILLIYHLAFNPVYIFNPIGLAGVFLLSWFTGVAIGMVFLALTPWPPPLVNILLMVYRRVNMLASGKMFVANTLPSFMLAMFDWNLLFHCVDQARGMMFINYSPMHSNLSYPLKVALVAVVLGLMGEFFTRKRASMSWGSTR
ncbi:ABC transporter permease [uncultured Planktomarina sp.]|jgi:ABC-type polysaccharide/polyol phosphate export permease|uniref:ABC transporter permease n=1 Tax=uncultured Planktomarina sp. TaxID=1538529 RepID=UPI003260B762